MPYHIGSGLSDHELAAAHWWVRHQIQLRRALFVSLGAFCVLTWGYALWVAFDAYILSYPKESRITARILSSTLAMGALESSAPQAIQANGGAVLTSTGGRQDLMNQLKNPNDTWWAEFTYRFDVGGNELTPEQKGFLLPQETFPFTALGYTGPRTGVANIQVSNVQWHRINPLTVDRNYETFQQAHWQLQFDNLSYQTDLELNGKKIGQTNLNIKNTSGYGYWHVDLAVLLYRFDQLVGINIIPVEQLKPGETRPLSLNWFENPLGVSKTVIIPHANILDPALYLSSGRF